MRKTQRRLDQLSKAFPVRPPVTSEQAIFQKAVQIMSGEDLMVMRRMMLAGRPLQSSNEREAAAVANYRSAVDSVIRLQTVENKSAGGQRRVRL